MTEERGSANWSGSGRTYLLTLGFGTAVSMWALGFVGRMPPAVLPSWLLLAGLLACLFVGGSLAARWTGSGWKAGTLVGVVSSLVNLLILGSLLGGEDPNRIVPSAVLWVPGSFLIGALMGGLGGFIGARSVSRPEHERTGSPEISGKNWTGGFAKVGMTATFLLLIVGGIVTSKEAGLAVVDWPNSYGYNMFLYPLAKMSGGIYYEHAHRLFGSLVGLTTLVLCVHLWKVEPKPRIKILALVALLMVIAQGILGGLRVTGNFTTSTDAAVMKPSLTLAMVHGVFGQLFFAVMVSLAVFTSSTWQTAKAVPDSSAGLERGLAVTLVAALFVQILLGAILRHRGEGLILHISWALVVAGTAVACGVRAWGSNRKGTPFGRLGLWLLAALGAQIAVGFAALPAVLESPEEEALAVASPPKYEVVVATLHQAGGAVLLALAVTLLLFTFRYLSRKVTEPAIEES